MCVGKAALIINVLLLFFIGFQSVSAFDLPKSDPWYYQADNRGLSFMIPDKAQHYWGSALLGHIGNQLPLPLKRLTVPFLALGAGYFWEMWQEDQGIGFSERDLIADAFGVLSSQINSRDLKMHMDYSLSKKTITLVLVKSFK